MDLASTPSDHASIALTVSITAAALVVQHFLRRSSPLAGLGPARQHAALKVGAGLVLGLAAVLGAALDPGGLSRVPMGLGTPAAVLPGLVLALVLVMAGVWVVSRSARFARDYPEAPIEAPDRKSWAENAIAWAIYLAGYELLFRGLCLHASVELLGLVPGVAVTTALYVVAHLPKSLGESLGSFPMGVLFAALALGGHSVLYPWLLHLAMAVFADTLALRARACT